MKKISIIIMVLVLLSNVSMIAQSSVQNPLRKPMQSCIKDSIIIDPVLGNSKGPFYVKYGKSIDVIYKHVNVFKVRVSGLLKTININFENADLFNSTEQSTQAVELVTLSNDSTNKGIQNNTNDDRVDYLYEYEKRHDDYVEKYQELQRLADLHDYLLDKLKGNYIRDIKQLQSSIKSTFAIAFGSEDETKYKQILEEIYFSLNGQKNYLYELSPDFSDNAALFVTKKKLGKTTIVLMTSQYEKVRTSYNKIMSIHDEVLKNKNKITQKVYNAIELWIRIKGESFERKENTGSITADAKLYTPRLVDFEGKVLEELKPIRIKTTGKVKVNTSAGYLLSFLGADNYALRRNAMGEFIGVSKQKSDDLTHAVGALFHVYKTRQGNATYGLSTGISLTQETNVGFYLGGSGHFLEKNRLVFTAGLSFTQQQILNTANLTPSTDGDQLNFVSSNDTEIRYDSLYKPAFFFGITYNLFDTKKTEE